MTDIETSTALWEQAPAEMQSALARHDEILRAAVTANGGYVFSTAGDGFGVAFETVPDAADMAVDVQRALQTEDWPPPVTIRVRIGVHVGVAEERGGDYFGPTVNRTARIMSVAHGGQILLSNAARELLDGYDTVDLGTHLLRDLNTPEHLWQLVAPGLRRDFPPPRTLEAVATNLPAPVSSFVGREEETAALVELLDVQRLVTLTGPGGVGKTRLALRAAAQLTGRFGGGVWLVELAPLQESEAVPYQILAAMGLAAAQRGQSPLQIAAAAIASQRALLLFDNCEHLRDAAAEAVSLLLAECPRLVVLATCREPLRVAGEALVTVSPLPVADRGAAQQLFWDRGRAVNPGLAPSTAQERLVEDICRHLDGLPLAIELAAARLRTMTPEDIASRLDARFRLLRESRGGRDVRHRTLHGTIDWSYRHLGEAEQRLFRRVAVFCGAFTVDAARAVCADDDLDDLDVIDLLAGLVDRSLVVAEVGEDQASYRLLESLRDYGLEHLGDEEQELRERHAAYHLRWIGEIEDRLLGPDERAARQELDRGWADLRAAVSWQIRNQHPERVAAMIGRLLLEMQFRYRLELGAWADTALASPAASGLSRRDRALLLCIAGCRQSATGDAALATAHTREALALLREEAAAELPRELVGAPSNFFFAGELAEALDGVRWFGDGAGRTDDYRRAMSWTLQATWLYYGQRLEEAAEVAARALAAMPADAAPTWKTFAAWTRARSSALPSMLVVSAVEDAVATFAEVGNRFMATTAAHHLATLRGSLGDLRRSMLELAASIDRAPRDDQRNAIGAVLRAAVLLLRVGDHRTAAVLLAWTDANRVAPVSPEVSHELDELLPGMRAALGEDEMAAAAEAAAISFEELLDLTARHLRQTAPAA